MQRVSTDLQTGQEIWVQEGNLADAVRASMALPGLFPAVRHEHRWLVDGGLVSLLRLMPVEPCLDINIHGQPG